MRQKTEATKRSAEKFIKDICRVLRQFRTAFAVFGAISTSGAARFIRDLVTL